MTAGDEICRMDATSLARQVAAKQLSPVEVVDAVLDRLDRLDPRLHIFATVYRGPGPAGGQAAGSRDRGRARGRPVGRGAHRREGPDLHQGHPHRLGLQRLRRLRARRGRRRGRTDHRGGRHRDRQDPGARVRLLRHRPDPARASRPATRGTPPAPPAGPPRAPARRWPPGSGRSHSAATAAARSASRPASAASTASSRRWAAYRSTRAPRTSATPACPAGSRWSTSARSPAPSPTRR